MRLRLAIALALTIPTLGWTLAPARASDSAGVLLPPGIPRDLWSYFVPRDNPVTPAKVELGRVLFFDKRLSSDGKVSCASCHDPQRAFADGKPLAEGVFGRRGNRNSPSLLNAMFNSGHFWDGRADSLEAQARLPLVHPDEMGNRSYDEVVAKLNALPEYTQRFRQAFGTTPTIELVAKAIAAYERTLVTGTSPFDRFLAGDSQAMSLPAQRGFALFRTKARCTVCHTFGVFSIQSYPFFSDQLYHNTGVAANHPDFEDLARLAIKVSRLGASRPELSALEKWKGSSELGRFLITGNSLDIGAFRTPSLRNVELTAPYFHDGSAATLEAVVRFYLPGGKNNMNRDWELQPINLTEEEQADLVEFLKSLTSDDARELVRAGVVNSGR